MPVKKSLPLDLKKIASEEARRSVSGGNEPKKSRKKKSPAAGLGIIASKKASPGMPAAGDTRSLGMDQRRRADKAELLLSVPSETIDLIRSWHRQRCFAMEQRKRIDLSLGSFLRMMLGWSVNLPDDERKAIAEQAKALLAGDETDAAFDTVIAASAAARKPFDDIEVQALKEMSALAKTLPAWTSFGVSMRGFGSASLAVIIGEAGDLSNYSSVAKLWKRMGLAVMDGARQGAPGKGAATETWIEHGYNPLRRSRMWNIGDTMLKGQIRKVKDSGEDTGERTSLGEYGAAYLARKAYEIARDPECKPIKAHRRAQRYMEKRLLKHLWQAWRGGPNATWQPTVPCLPSPPNHREAVQLM